VQLRPRQHESQLPASEWLSMTSGVSIRTFAIPPA
jgi:hypothetical protein